MDFESIRNNISTSNRFQVNRVDSVAAGHHSPAGIRRNSATLVGYKPYSRGSINTTLNMASMRDSIAPPVDEESRATSPSMLITSGIGGSTGNNGNNNNIVDMDSSNMYNHHHHRNSSVYDTKYYAKSFRHFTREALPRLDNYRNMMSIQAAYRPTLDELHNEPDKARAAPQNADAPPESGMVKFGWVKGVFVRCLLNIWGVMLFLRLSWVVGQAGVIEAFCVILLATAVTFVTGLSMSAISTNGTIKGVQTVLIILFMSCVTCITAISLSTICTNGSIRSGGTYYMISRSLGPECGGSIGLIFALANAIAVAMYTVGFAESLTDLLKSLDTQIVEDQGNNIRIIGSVAIILQTCVVVIGMEWEATAQVGLLFILLAAMVDFVVGSFIGPLSTEELSKGFVGLNGSLLVENLGSAYRFSEGMEQSFFSVFSIFFPAATGILAGANISGDLADPQVAIPKGTMLAIFVTTASYLAFAVLAGATVVRDATGPGPFNGSEDWDETFEGFRNCYLHNETTGSTDFICSDWGLMNSFQVMELVSAWGPLIYAGCFAATLSSALASFVSAPKVFQALCKDKLYPYIGYFGKGYGKNNEPVRGYVLTFVIALAFILIAELNAIAPLISNFFLAAYALVNFSTFHASLAKPVGWRPTFKYYNKWLSLLGAILCVAVMFLISWSTALITIAVIFFLYLIVIYNKPDVNWGSSTQAQTYKNALTSVQQLSNVDDHVKNYRPQILVLTGLPSSRPVLVDFAYLITKHLSLLACGHTLKTNLNSRTRASLTTKAQYWYQAKKIKAFYCPVDDTNFEEGAKAILQAYGVGKLRPNIVLLGYKQNWMECNSSELLQYFNVLHKAFDMQLSVAILRVRNGLDLSKKIVFGDQPPPVTNSTSASPNHNNLTNVSDPTIPRNQSAISQFSQDLGNIFSLGKRINGFGFDSSNDDTEIGIPTTTTAEFTKEKMKEIKKLSKTSPIYKSIEGGDVPKDISDRLMTFQKKYKHGVIDVWWLYDDGGLTLLLPYIINSRSNFSTCKLRVFALANKKDEFETDQRNMAGLLAKFRIDYSDLQIIPDVNKKPLDSTKQIFNKYIEQFRGQQNNESEPDLMLTDVELSAQRDKCNRHMRLHELLQENSRGSSLVVMTLPMPRKGMVSAPLYMSWLELLTHDMPPFLLVRGNQTSVLTFYS